MKKREVEMEKGTDEELVGSNVPTDEKVVFIVRRDTRCSKCKEELPSHSFVYLEKGEPLCMSCAGLEHLTFLPPGDACVTRRAKKHSRLYAVVVKWSRTRKRYERQGILVEEEAVQKARQEAEVDAQKRKKRQEASAIKREKLEREYVEKFAQKIRELFPNCPPGEEMIIAENACKKYSGRVGRSSMAKKLDPKAIILAVQAHVRHNYTNYDDIVYERQDRFLARQRVSLEVEEILDKWSGS